jgi:hypothetical protein
VIVGYANFLRAPVLSCANKYYFFNIHRGFINGMFEKQSNNWLLGEIGKDTGGLSAHTYFFSKFMWRFQGKFAGKFKVNIAFIEANFHMAHSYGPC